MTMPNMRPAKAVGEQMIFAAGQFVQPSPYTAVNLQILPANLAAGSIGTSQLSPTQTVSPSGSRIPIFVNPDGSQPGNAGNQVALPKGVASGITPNLGSEFLLDFSGFSADIVNVSCNLIGTSRGTSGFKIIVSAVDNINKLVYLQGTGLAGTGNQVVFGGVIVAWQVAFKDTFSV